MIMQLTIFFRAACFSNRQPNAPVKLLPFHSYWFSICVSSEFYGKKNETVNDMVPINWMDFINNLLWIHATNSWHFWLDNPVEVYTSNCVSNRNSATNSLIRFHSKRWVDVMRLNLAKWQHIIIHGNFSNENCVNININQQHFLWECHIMRFSWPT